MGTICTGWIRQELASFMVKAARDRRHDVSFGFVNDRPIPSARNRLALGFLKTDCDYLLSVDSDVWPYKNLLDLVDRNLDIVIFPVPIWRPASSPPIAICFTPLVMGDNIIKLESGKVEEVSWGGSAFLVARRVFEGMEPPWYENAYDGNGITVGTEDEHFCRTARQAGFKVWVAHDYLCGHVKEVDIVDVWAHLTKTRR